MKLFPPPLVIGDTEGFTDEKDLFGRKTVGEGMTNLLTQVAEPLTVAVDGQWGSGKTTFLKMWAGELRKRNIPVAYFDAFANDHVDDAFSAIAHCLISLTRQYETKSSAVTRSFAASASGLARVVGRGVLKAGLRIATQGLVDEKDVGDWVKIAQEEASGVTDKIVDDLLAEQTSRDTLMLAFRQALESLPSVLSQVKDPDGSHKPLIIIVDELDRCRPTFAIEVLERIKHFFSVLNTHFVLGLNSRELHNSIRTVYGREINAAQYLEKFIHLSVFLADSKRALPERDVAKFVDHWRSTMGFSAQQASDFQDASGLIIHIAETQQLPIRSIERILSNLTLAISTAPPNWLKPPAIIAGLCVLKALHMDQYLRAKSGTLTFEDVKGPLALEHPSRDELKPAMHTVNVWWQHCLGHKVHTDLGIRLLADNGLESHQVIPRLAAQIVDFWGKRPLPAR